MKGQCSRGFEASGRAGRRGASGRDRSDARARPAMTRCGRREATLELAHESGADEQAGARDGRAEGDSLAADGAAALGREQCSVAHQTRVDDADTAAVLAFWTVSGSGENDAPALEALLRGWFLHDDGTAASEAEVRHRGNLAAFERVDADATATSRRARRSGARRATGSSTTSRARSAARWSRRRDPTLDAMTYTVGNLEPCYKPLLYYLALQTVHAAVHTVLRLRGCCGRGRAGRLRTSARPALRVAAATAAGRRRRRSCSCTASGGLLAATSKAAVADGRPPRRRRPRPPILASAPSPPRPPSAAPPPRRRCRPTSSSRRSRPWSAATPRRDRAARSFLAPLWARRPRLGGEGRPEAVGAAAFVDPICFLLHHPAVVHNFLYRPPRARPPPAASAASANAGAFPVD